MQITQQDIQCLEEAAAEAGIEIEEGPLGFIQELVSSGYYFRRENPTAAIFNYKLANSELNDNLRGILEKYLPFLKAGYKPTLEQKDYEILKGCMELRGQIQIGLAIAKIEYIKELRKSRHSQ